MMRGSDQRTIAPAWAPLEETAALDGFALAFAALLRRLCGEQACPELLSAVGALCSGLAVGHGCVDLHSITAEVQHWRRTLLAMPVVGEPGRRCPLVLDAQNRLYLYRYWYYEHGVAGPLLQRARAVQSVSPQALQQALDALFPAVPELAAARAAAVIAAGRSLCIVSGGPGTGKSSTIVRILAMLLQLCTTLRIALVAPTGKAAVRLQSAVQSALQGLPVEVPAPLAAQAQHTSTLHRLLGARPDGSYRHGPGRLLPLDVLVVDEASMVDVALMWRLQQALPEQARLILAGDQDQLASVEPGAVFHELCRAAPAPDLPERAAPAGPAGHVSSAAELPLSHCIAFLHHNFRFAADSGIAALAEAVRSGDVQAVCAILDRPPPELQFHEFGVDDSPAERIAARVQEWYMPEQELDGEQALEDLRRFRILVVQRHGRWGVSGLNAAVLQHLGRQPQQWFPGRQLMVLENQHELNLYNGDLGMVLPRPGGLRAVFPSTALVPREFARQRLPRHEDAYAMTIHKSQGSEFDRVLLVLPPQPEHPLLSRRLLYTGITRARRTVEIWASREALCAAVERDEPRASGLYDMLVGGGQQPGSA